MVNKEEDASTAGGAGAVCTDGRVIGEVFEFRVLGESGFLNSGYFDIVGDEEVGEFVIAVEDPVSIELEDIEV